MARSQDDPQSTPQLDTERAVDAYDIQLVRRLRALMERHNLAAQNDGEMFWPRLVMAWAVEHETEFQKKDKRGKGPGAPRKWTRELELLLAAQVNEIRAQGNSVATACDELLDKSPWKSWATRPQQGKTLKSSTLVKRYKKITRIEPGLSWRAVKNDSVKRGLHMFEALIENHPDISQREAKMAETKLQRKARREIDRGDILLRLLGQ